MTKNFLRQIRKQRDLRVVDISNALNVSDQIIRRFENGTSSISIKKIDEILKYLNISYEYLMTGEDKNNSASTSKQQELMLHAFNMVYKVYGNDNFDDSTIHAIANNVYLQLPNSKAVAQDPEVENRFLEKMKEQYFAGLAAKCFIHNKK